MALPLHGECRNTWDVGENDSSFIAKPCQKRMDT